MSQTSVWLIDFPRVEGSTRDVNAQSPKSHRQSKRLPTLCIRRDTAVAASLKTPCSTTALGKRNRSTLPSQVIRFSGQKLRSLIPDCCRISLRGNPRRRQLFAKSTAHGFLYPQ